jgi:hypothetical protein
MNSPDSAAWTAARLVVLAPAWTPDPSRARAALSEAKPAAGRAWRYGLAAAGVALAIAAAAPAGRTVAQALWRRVTVTRVDVIRLDPARIPLEMRIRTLGEVPNVGSIEAAAAAAGFMPQLPPAYVLPGVPVFGVMRTVEITQTIRRARLVAALQAAGAGDVDVPLEWEGVTLRAMVGPTLTARYSGQPTASGQADDVQVLQMPPIQVETPAGFPLQRFLETVFRAAGLPAPEARERAADYAANPALLLSAARDASLEVDTVALPGGGDALVFEDRQAHGTTRTAVIVSRPARVYNVISASREQGLRIEATLP